MTRARLLKVFRRGVRQTPPSTGCRVRRISKPYDQTSERFPDDYSSDDIFAHPAWLAASRTYVQNLSAQAAQGQLIPEAYLSPLGFMCAEIKRSKGRLEILDLGGGMGPCVPAALSSVGSEAVRYVVVDNAPNCAVGRELFPQANFEFLTAIPSDARPDVVLMSSALQYVGPWQSVLDRCADLRPQHFYLSRLPLWGRQTGAARQHIQLPGLNGCVWHWVFGDELPRHLENHGYWLSYDQFIRDLTDEFADTAEAGRVDLRLQVFTRGGARGVTAPS